MPNSKNTTARIPQLRRAHRVDRRLLLFYDACSAGLDPEDSDPALLPALEGKQGKRLP
jgi:hypothetical protein